MIVAVGAPGCQTQKSRAVCFRPFAFVVHAKLFTECASLGSADSCTHICRGDHRVQSFVRHHISGKLLLDELIEVLVLVIGFDHIVAVGPDTAEVIGVKAVRVSIAGHVHPIVRTMLTVARTCQQPVHNIFVRIGRIIFEERFDFFWSRRETCEVIRHAPNERPPIRFR